MDPYIDPESLDPSHPLTKQKLANLALASSEMQLGTIKLESLPSKVTFQTTDVCNLTCPHCQIPKSYKVQGMPMEFIDLLATTLLPNLIELHPTNVGEPFAWKYFKELCKKMQEYGVVLDLTTNGTLLNRDRLEWIAPIARDIKISFDGATASTFEQFRAGARFDAVCENVRALVYRMRQVRIRRPIVALQMTLMRDNVDELPTLIELAHKLGVDRVKAYHLFSFDTTTREQSLMMHLQHYENVVLPLALEMGDALSIDLQLAEPSGGLLSDLRERRCFLPWHETWIDVDGSILICHSHSGKLAGHLQHFQDAWNGDLYRSVRSGLVKGTPFDACHGCGMNLEKDEEHAPVPYDPSSFLGETHKDSMVRWSGRMRPFDLRDRRSWSTQHHSMSQSK